MAPLGHGALLLKQTDNRVMELDCGKRVDENERVLLKLDFKKRLNHECFV